jgi:hypothetical protein
MSISPIYAPTANALGPVEYGKSYEEVADALDSPLVSTIFAYRRGVIRQHESIVRPKRCVGGHCAASIGTKS